MPLWSKILFQEEPEKQYNQFLKWLIENNFYKNLNKHLTVKKIAADSKHDYSKIIKWISLIYEDILTLNDEKPGLFLNNGFALSLHIKQHDNYAFINISLPYIPRELESFRFFFVKAKVGVDFFWIQKVEYEIDDNQNKVIIYLRGGFVNKYREYAIDKAVFQGQIPWADIYRKHDFEIDETLKQLYK